MTCSLRRARKGVSSTWWCIIEYCSSLFHSLVNTRSGRFESRPVSCFASFLHYKWPMLGSPVPSPVPLAPAHVQGMLPRGTSVVASQVSSSASDLCVMKCPFVQKSSSLNHTVQQFCWKENSLGCTWWIRMTLVSLLCFCFAERVITATTLSLCYGHTFDNTFFVRPLWRKIVWVLPTVTKNLYIFYVVTYCN